MFDKADDNEIKNNILAIGGNELEIWKRTVIADDQLFEQIFHFIFSDDPKIAWRSCWIIDSASEDYPDLLTDKIPAIISGLLTTKNSSLKRHFTRILCRYKIPDEYLGEVVDRSFLLLSTNEPAAVRVFAMQLLFNIAQDFPDLKVELICYLDNLLEEGASAGFINRATKLLRKLRS